MNLQATEQGPSVSNPKEAPEQKCPRSMENKKDECWRNNGRGTLLLLARARSRVVAFWVRGNVLIYRKNGRANHITSHTLRDMA